ncbi:MAG TPA: hypothetical protein PKD54_08315 [Pirellulaceae bacterium]|nr:hypothetical protein [Pirellulaceae bacterium]
MMKWQGGWPFLSIVCALFAIGIWSRPNAGPVSDSPLSQDVEEAQDDERLVCIGALAGINVYITQDYIAMIADLFKSDVIDSEKAKLSLDTIRALTLVSSDQLRVIRGLHIIEEDQEAINHLLAINDLLAQSAEALSAYSQSKDEADFKKYEASRQEVHPKILKLLGLQ